MASTVVVISGWPRLGKADLIASLCLRLPGSAAVCMEDYQSFMRKSPKERKTWSQTGRDPGDGDLSDLAGNLHRQKEDRTVTTGKSVSTEQRPNVVVLKQSLDVGNGKQANSLIPRFGLAGSRCVLWLCRKVDSAGSGYCRWTSFKRWRQRVIWWSTGEGCCRHLRDVMGYADQIRQRKSCNSTM